MGQSLASFLRKCCLNCLSLSSLEVPMLYSSGIRLPSSLLQIQLCFLLGGTAPRRVLITFYILVSQEKCTDSLNDFLIVHSESYHTLNFLPPAGSRRLLTLPAFALTQPISLQAGWRERWTCRQIANALLAKNFWQVSLCWRRGSIQTATGCRWRFAYQKSSSSGRRRNDLR